ncbi:MAG: sugar phosphate isomerase/epimerase [Proteobacteria bacterium]|nr:sugar phosphate isomerase/epimerase [Pseudomonadota bacterium]MBI3496715.1 sugar phosphate isomerase/epimerase [Pseudomonadota bacterium]
MAADKRKPPTQISFQLYSSRKFPPLERQLETLARIGYAAVEPWLPAYDADPAEFRRQIDAAGLACFGFHMSFPGLVDEPQRFMDMARTFGASTLIVPSVPRGERVRDVDGWRRVGDGLRRGAELADAAGLRVAWHNHDFEYVRLADGKRPIDHIFEAAGPTVEFEIDCGWITRAGTSVADELQRFAERITIIQTKDMAPLGTVEEDGWTATGDGIIDWKALWPLFLSTPVEYFVVEHDDPADWARFAERSYRYLKRIIDNG